MSDDIKKPREFMLGTIAGGACDGGDIFAVLSCEPKISFKEMLAGVRVIDYAAYEKRDRDAKAFCKAYDDALGTIVELKKRLGEDPGDY